jgi:hypothetical protein
MEHGIDSMEWNRVNAEAKVLAGIRWAHETEVMAVCAPVCLAGKRMRDYSIFRDI